MSDSRKIYKKLKVGDLVTHALYGREWIGIIIEIEQGPDSDFNFRNTKALVQMQPGTKFDGFFEKNSLSENKIHSNMGYVSIHWLFRIK